MEGSFLYSVGNVSCSEQVDASGNNVVSLNTTDGAVSKPVGGIMSVPLKKKQNFFKSDLLLISSCKQKDSI